MICKISSDEILTDLEARKKYRDKHIGYVTIEQNMLDPYNEKIMVLYTADSNDEVHNIPHRTENNEIIAITAGMGVGGTEISSVFYDE